MPSWKTILDEVREAGGGHDVVRRKHLKRLARVTGRNVIIYYSGWLQKGDMIRGGTGLAIDDNDKNGFMAAVHGLDRAKGLDLVLHTPGGDLAAAESLVDYLRAMFGTDIRAIVPQLAMSAGTMISCAAKEVIMGKHSNLGPIDPQMGGVSAHAFLATWNEAKAEIAANPQLANLWMPVLGRYHPGLLLSCRQAIDWSEKIVTSWLETGMFQGDAQATVKAQAIVSRLGSHAQTLSHARHLHRDELTALGLKIAPLEADAKFQDAVLTVHHCAMNTLTDTGAFKIIENQNGSAHIRSVRQLILASNGQPG